MAVLARRWALHDVQDVEALCGWVIERSKLKLGHHEREDLLAYLLALTWELSLVYDPGELPSNFSGWATTRLRVRTIDWFRSQRGRTRWQFAGHTYERKRPQLISLDADDSERDRLDAALSRSRMERDASGLAADMRALDARGRRPGRRVEYLGGEAA